jgi:membrane associated rhomboid family serine protease
VLPLGDDNEPGRGLAVATLAIIAINVAVFVLLQLGSDAFTYGYSVVPREITTGVDLIGRQVVVLDGQRVAIPEAPGPTPIYLTLLTAMFLHGGWLHLGGNMLFLWVFGDNVEHALGAIPYVVFYIVAGVVASFAQIWLEPGSIIPTLGASGAISGILGAYLVLFPSNRVRVLAWYWVVAVPAVVVIGMWALLQFFYGFASIAETQQTGGVAYMAHVGGFISGVVAALVARSMGVGRRGPPRNRYAT